MRLVRSQKPRERVVVAQPGDGADPLDAIIVPVSVERDPAKRREVELVVHVPFVLDAAGGATVEREPDGAPRPARVLFDGALPGRARVLIPTLDEDRTMRLLPLTPGAVSRPLPVPQVIPRGYWIPSREDTAVPIPLVLDRAFQDEEGPRLVTVYRGRFDAWRADPSEAHVFVYLDHARDPRSPSVDYRIAALAYAVEDHDRTEGAALPDGAELMLARLALADGDEEPLIPIDTYAGISAELAERREPPAQTLARYELDVATFTLIERAWLERMANLAQEGEPALAVMYGELFVAAQDALASPRELERTRADYAAVRARIERADDPMQALAPRGMTLAEWMRLDRRMTREAELDSAVNEEIERLVREEHAKLLKAEGPAEAESDGDDDGGEA